MHSAVLRKGHASFVTRAKTASEGICWSGFVKEGDGRWIVELRLVRFGCWAACEGRHAHRMLWFAPRSRALTRGEEVP